MKNILTLILLLLVGKFSFGQETSISYVNPERVKDSSKSPFPDWDTRISEIEFKSKNKFVFHIRPTYHSCWTWSEYHGTWEQKNDTLIFSDHYQIRENDARFAFSNNPQNANYVLQFDTDKTLTVAKKSIKIEFVYDFDSELENVKLDGRLDKDFRLKIPFNKVPNREYLAAFRYECFLSNGVERYGYITESETINMKEGELPNQIRITLIENPKEDIIYRITKATLVNNELNIISTEKSMSNVPDFHQKLRFKEVYRRASEK